MFFTWAPSILNQRQLWLCAVLYKTFYGFLRCWQCKLFSPKNWAPYNFSWHNFLIPIEWNISPRWRLHFKFSVESRLDSIWSLAKNIVFLRVSICKKLIFFWDRCFVEWLCHFLLVDVIFGGGLSTLVLEWHTVWYCVRVTLFDRWRNHTALPLLGLTGSWWESHAWPWASRRSCKVISLWGSSFHFFLLRNLKPRFFLFDCLLLLDQKFSFLVGLWRDITRPNADHLAKV